MAFIGNTPTTQAFTPAIDYFSGTGSATAFTLSRPVASVAQVQVTIDNVAQNPSTAYTVSGSTITFTSAPLSGTNNIYVYYTSPITQVIAPGQSTVTATSFVSSTGTGAGVFQTSPTITTPVISSLSSASATALTLQSAGTTAITVDTSQNVGIGTASPAGNLQISGSGDRSLLLTGGTSGTISVQLGDSVAAGQGGMSYDNSVDALFFKSNGSERMRITSGGNVGINTTPVAMSGGGMQIGNSTIVQQVVSDQALFSNNAYYDGNWKAVRAQNGYSCIRPGAVQGGIQFMCSSTATTAGGSLPNMDGSDIKMTILPTGYVGIGTTSPTVKLFVAASDTGPRIAVDQTADNAADMITFRRNGSERGKIYISDSATVYQTSSDYRLKKNITPLTGSLETVAKLKPSSFTWVQERGGQQDTGFIAHELAEVMPQAVTGEKDATREEQYEVTPAVKDEEGNITTPAVMGTRTVPSYQGIDTSFLVATLTAAIQELKAINDTQAETINALTARITALENR